MTTLRSITPQPAMHPPQTKMHGFLLPWMLIVSIFSCERDSSEAKSYTLSGALSKWQPVTLAFRGPHVSETDSVNPFMDYRLVADFKNDSSQIRVDGFFAADGNAGNSGASDGDLWKILFSPEKAGKWKFDARFLRGSGVAFRDPDSEDSEELWRIEGNFDITEVDSAETGFYRDGKLTGGSAYLRMSETGKLFIKNGVEAMDSFLASSDLEGTADPGDPMSAKAFHQEDWTEEDPLWGDEQGKSLIGALNYLASAGLNSLSLSTTHIGETGRQVYPWLSAGQCSRYDVSKLDQWEQVFRHMDRLGISIDFRVADSGETPLALGSERHLYFREMVSRFSHHPGLVWHLPSGDGTNTDQLKADADLLRSLDPYRHPIALSNALPLPDTVNGKPSKAYGIVFKTLTEISGMAIGALHLPDTTELHKEALKWVRTSRKARSPWALDILQPGLYSSVQPPDSTFAGNYRQLMKTTLWGSLMAGAAGNSWKVPKRQYIADGPLDANFREMDSWWQITQNATQFFTSHVNFTKMQSHDELLSNPAAFCLASVGEEYLVYLPEYEQTDLAIGDGNYVIAFFDPYRGGKLLDKKNQGWEITKANSVSLSAYDGQQHKDWVILIKKK